MSPRLYAMLLVIISLPYCSSQASAQEEKKPNAAQSKDSTMNDYQAKTHEASNGLHLPYRYYEPKEIVAGSKLPLLIFLHGAGERGDDNVKQLKHGAKEFTKHEFQERYPCFVISPQCRNDHKWCEVDWSATSVEQPAKPSDEMAALFELIDSSIKSKQIDPSRIYLTGLSMGGFGTWDAIARRPDFFAAAIPICGGGDTKTASKIKDLPVWCFHGSADPTVPVSLSRQMIEAIKSAGGEPKYTEYPDVKHDSWTATYKNPELYEWLFQQKAK